MSNFILTNNQSKFEIAVRRFANRGLVESGRKIFDNMYFASFKKRSIDNENYLSFGEDDFICSVGSFLYKQKVGKPALMEAYDNFNGYPEHLQLDAVFQGTLVIRKNGNVTIVSDKYHVYWTYYFNDNGTYYVSSSLSSVIQALDKRILNVDRFIEAVIQRGSIGKKMFYENVFKLFGNEQISVRDNKFSVTHTEYKLDHYDFSDASTDEIVTEFSELLLGKFQDIYKVFGNEIGIHLSGGFDSRLLLAACLNLGCKPTILYGLGNSPLTSQYSQDKILVEKIRKTFGLNVHYMNWNIDRLIGKDETRANFRKFGFNCNENYCNNSWYKEYTENVGNHVKVLFDGHMGETLNIEAEDNIFGDLIPEEFDMNYIFDEYQKVFFNNFSWRSVKQKSAHEKYLRNELNECVNIFGLPSRDNKMCKRYYQKYWHLRYRPADSHPTNLFNDFLYSFSPLGIPKLHDFVLDIPFEMIRKRGFSIKTINYLVPELSKIDYFSRAGLIRIEDDKIIRTPGRTYEMLRNIHAKTPSIMINAYRGVKKTIYSKKDIEKTPMWKFYVSWLSKSDLLGKIFDFDKQIGDVRLLATAAIYTDAIEALGYDDVKYES